MKNLNKLKCYVSSCCEFRVNISFKRKKMCGLEPILTDSPSSIIFLNQQPKCLQYLKVFHFLLIIRKTIDNGA